MQTDLKKIISISGHSGLYRYLSQGRNGVIVESLKDGKRTSVSKTTKISPLSDITIYTESDDDISIKDILLKLKQHSGASPVPSRQLSPEELTKYFADVVPEYDKDRVQIWHITKITEWYNILLERDMIDFEETKTEEPENQTTENKTDEELQTSENKPDEETKPNDQNPTPENKPDEELRTSE